MMELSSTFLNECREAVLTWRKDNPEEPFVKIDDSGMYLTRHGDAMSPEFVFFATIELSAEDQNGQYDVYGTTGG